MVKLSFSVWLWTASLLFFSTSCNQGSYEEEVSVVDEENEITDQRLHYTNPVFEPVLADPSVIQANGYFYAYGTEDHWGSEGGYHLVPVVRSKDLIHWEYVRDAFSEKPDWKPRGGIWAPDVTPVGNEYYMYYSFSIWGDPNPGIGLAIAQYPEGPFVDQGQVFLSNDIGVANSIDPYYWEEDGQKYLFWGSFHGIYAVPLTDDGTQVAGEKVKIAADHLEAVYIHKYDQYYYLFGSEGSCCEGAESTYRVRVGRSASLLEPYRDRQGNALTDGAYGEILLQGQDGGKGFAGPGHNAEIITDDEKNDWLLYHAMLKELPKLENGTNRRSLMLDRIYWYEGWPYVQGNQPSTGVTQGPYFNKNEQVQTTKLTKIDSL